jgi:hypothetical protein
MMSRMPLETCWAFNKHWNNKFYYKVASGWLFLLIQSSFILWCIVLLSSNYYHFLFAHADLSKPAECKEQSWWFIGGWLFAILKENAREADLAPKIPVVSTFQVRALLIYGMMLFYVICTCRMVETTFVLQSGFPLPDRMRVRGHTKRGGGLRRWTSTPTLAKMFLS